MTSSHDRDPEHAVGGPSRTAEQVAEYWSNTAEDADAFSNATYWLALPRVMRRYNELAAGGRPCAHWLNFCVEHFLGPRRPVERILSVGCGDGEMERHLACLDAATDIDAFDIAPRRVELAAEEARRAGLGNIHYSVLDAETAEFPSSRYDAIFFNASLHHICNLEGVLLRSARALAPDGYLFLIEYIGPSRFAFTDREKEALGAAHQLIPEKYRVSLLSSTRGQVLRKALIPDPEEVARVDPSEAVRSADIVGVLGEYFEVEELNEMGGTLLQFLLLGIAGNFRDDDPHASALLELLISIEDGLISCGDLESHFALIVARPKPAAELERKSSPILKA